MLTMSAADPVPILIVVVPLLELPTLMVWLPLPAPIVTVAALLVPILTKPAPVVSKLSVLVPLAETVSAPVELRVVVLPNDIVPLPLCKVRPLEPPSDCSVTAP